MTAASDNLVRKVRDRCKAAFKVLSGSTLWPGAYAALGNRDHGTAGNRGRAQSMIDDVAGLIPLGFVDQKAVGIAAETVEASIELEGHIEYLITITDDAGDITDVGRLVYLTDDATFTLTRPTTIGIPVGITTRFNAVNSFDVYFFSFGELLCIALSGGGRQSWLLAVVEPSGSSGNVATGIVAPCHGLIGSVYGIVVEAIADADADYDFNLEIAATNVTGGVIEFVTADLLGAKKAGTAITAANVFHEGDLIDVECVANTAGTAGDGKMAIYADVFLQPGV